METAKIISIKSQIYIPPQIDAPKPAIPPHHPTLIVTDSTSDLSHAHGCGCTGDSCIKERAWFYGPNGEVKAISTNINGSDAAAAQHLYNDSNGRLS